MEHSLLSNQAPQAAATEPLSVQQSRRQTPWLTGIQPPVDSDASIESGQPPCPQSATPPAATIDATPAAPGVPVITQVFQHAKWKAVQIPKLPNTRQNKPLAMYFLAEEKLSTAVQQLEKQRDSHSASFKEAADRVHMCQRILLNTIYLVYSGMDTSWRSSRSYRQYLPDEDQQELNRTFSESILFAAQALTRGFQIRGIESRSEALAFPATELCASLDALRFVFRQRASECSQPPYEPLYPVLCDFDRAWTTFERQLCFAYFDVGNSELRNSGNTDVTADDDHQLAMLTVILSETVMRSVSHGIVQSDSIECFEPAVMMGIPRLAIVHALLYSPGSLNLTNPDNVFWWFRPHVISLAQIQVGLEQLPASEVTQLERMLASGDDHSHPSLASTAMSKDETLTPDNHVGLSYSTDRTRMRREGTPLPPPLSPAHSVQSSASSTDVEDNDDDGSLGVVIDSMPLKELFLRICQVADGLQSGTFAKPFIHVMQKVFQMHASAITNE
ncbi:hypothetical protein H4R33_000786 [Dimargaris cristalligena]|uniref:Uncharacterized protein n=1 Tax=Dimargaris cristalligena TaxID=215637 RepID=A0A4P9ZTS3_9FUNG|nr:hypothetical protein H4R33_000786 [Dimargaris cristalligena]RKP36172.1 hypothetical protein BJ085DRAFT_29967 [Dimargaris cristalligena]|eukprot:RKP36172.1 hypothetical protein BJ085DRAFT_29967 [Dimargaris cristalligena]